MLGFTGSGVSGALTNAKTLLQEYCLSRTREASRLSLVSTRSCNAATVMEVLVTCDETLAVHLT
eukprot:6443767-Amphidinium_carterae.1